MTRDKLYELMADTWDRVVGPVKTALDTAGMSLENIDQVWCRTKNSFGFTDRGVQRNS